MRDNPICGRSIEEVLGLIDICPDCDEAYPARQGVRCTACQGDGYYRILSDAASKKTEDQKRD